MSAHTYMHPKSPIAGSPIAGGAEYWALSCGCVDNLSRAIDWIHGDSVKCRRCNQPAELVSVIASDVPLDRHRFFDRTAETSDNLALPTTTDELLDADQFSRDRLSFLFNYFGVGRRRTTSQSASNRAQDMKKVADLVDHLARRLAIHVALDHLDVAPTLPDAPALASKNVQDLKSQKGDHIEAIADTLATSLLGNKPTDTVADQRRLEDAHTQWVNAAAADYRHTVLRNDVLGGRWPSRDFQSRRAAECRSDSISILRHYLLNDRKPATLATRRELESAVSLAVESASLRAQLTPFRDLLTSR